MTRHAAERFCAEIHREQKDDGDDLTNKKHKTEKCVVLKVCANREIFKQNEHDARNDSRGDKGATRGGACESRKHDEEKNAKSGNEKIKWTKVGINGCGDQDKKAREEKVSAHDVAVVMRNRFFIGRHVVAVIHIYSIQNCTEK